MPIFIVLMIMLFGLAGFGTQATIYAQTYQERQLLKLFRQKTKKPLPAERNAQRREWNRLRQQHEYYRRQQEQKQLDERNQYGKQIAGSQALKNPQLTLRQAGPLGEAFRISSRAAKNAVERQNKKQYLIKRSQKYKTRNGLKPIPPIFRTEFIAR
ncbi:MAG: hypothetical protein HQM13_19400 [SAR324 cluster bacterium]|nr:hypothetical protein [SAR324 cluster bacterium]